MVLRERYGSGLREDYADFPMHAPARERNTTALRASLRLVEDGLAGVECVHGHFLPLKYLLLATTRDVRFATWMRNPADRVVSHFRYWQRTYNPKTAPALHRKMMEEAWSLERFCLGPELKDLYAQFLWGFPLEYFHFVGITEFYEEDLTYFSACVLGTPARPFRANRGRAGQEGGGIEPSLRRRIESVHARDMDLCGRALAMRLARSTD
jgi:hypothetical protein